MLGDDTETLELERSRPSLPTRILAFLEEGRAATSREIIDALDIPVSDRFHVAVKRLVEQGKVERLDRGRFRFRAPTPPADKIPFQAWLETRTHGEVFAVRDLAARVREPYQVVTQRIETLLRSGGIERLGRGLYAIGAIVCPLDLSLYSKADAVRRIMSTEPRAWTLKEIQQRLDDGGVDAVASHVLGNMSKNGGVIRLGHGLYVLASAPRALS